MMQHSNQLVNLSVDMKTNEVWFMFVFMEKVTDEWGLSDQNRAETGSDIVAME